MPVAKSAPNSSSIATGTALVSKKNATVLRAISSAGIPPRRSAQTPSATLPAHRAGTGSRRPRDGDLVARGPAHPRAEHGPKRRNVGEHRQTLQRTGDPDTDRPRMGRPATQLPQAGRERQDRHRDCDQPTEPQKSASQAVRRDIARERLGIRDTGRAAPRGDYGLVCFPHALMRRRPCFGGGSWPWQPVSTAVVIRDNAPVVESSTDVLVWRPLVPMNATGAHTAHPAARAARAPRHVHATAERKDRVDANDSGVRGGRTRARGGKI
jgi:hypothetical protein